ncbi:unnamed protein product [Paramecium sonneborni]|uniref:Uncharacterized protein n=1 Tax=Paramecium sonneborni TaxID=65129 RepID=A0A8S1NPB8_9CILI|nr:unnamed protein product [Paramecium sonneborni]
MMKDNFKSIAYLIQKLKSALITYTNILLQQIKSRNIESNQYLEYAIILIQKILNPEFYLKEYIKTIYQKKNAYNYLNQLKIS